MALLSFEKVAKTFAGIPVLQSIDLDVDKGQVVALVGENGAGKSTLMRIAAGLMAPSTGRITFDGAPAPATLVAAEQAGIVMVHQEFCLAPHLSVAENVFLGREIVRGPFIDRRASEAEAARMLAELGSSASPKARLRDLPVSDWQMIELAKAFARRPKIILMDEPTAVLSAMEAARLFERIRAFTEGGGAVIFTSHRLDEVEEIADRVAVLRDGRIVRVEDVPQISQKDMAEAMVGRPLSEIYPARRSARDGDVLMEVCNLTSPGAVSNVSLAIRRGEILGLSGLVGSGRTELFEALFGLRPASCQHFRVCGRDRALPNARDAWRLGLAYLTEDRKGKGLLLTQSIAQNVALVKGALAGPGWIDAAAERRGFQEAVRAYDIRGTRLDGMVGALSGGNQQKVLIAKTLAIEPEIVVFDEPTRGVDIGAKQQIYEVIARLAEAGKGVVVISSEMQEIVGLADRVLVMRQGRITGELRNGEISEQAIIRFAMGLQEEMQHV
ncbi:sugar ABC transporter ATP-binding protein [Ochrobactrum chromiisoli]|uniref:Sugar ABC transporter ATP-binding protein n=1 Tax=Ochrobactrum chromiisoli TaxID=2993941 RepID=A0ABT3QTU8_9HYPH|nr:sugar ABC transporter ATP-binding protein [Ochrobactrum chromiisoli]MCX2699055.1 sugar ABC transporter ATP-binding protein [Ochrobactrum chromiisoli]